MNWDMAVLAKRYAADTPESVHPARWRAMKKQIELNTKKCGARLDVQRYGMGSQYSCPFCDESHNGYVKTRYWTKANPPRDEECPNQIPDSGRLPLYYR